MKKTKRSGIAAAVLLIILGVSKRSPSEANSGTWSDLRCRLRGPRVDEPSWRQRPGV